MHDISVIVPTRNRPQKIERCLWALSAQTYSHDRFEVIVVDDGSDASLAPQILPFREHLQLQLIEQKKGGPARARNTGAKQVITPEFPSLVSGLFATDAEQSVCSLESLLRVCFGQQPASDRYLMLGYNVSVPPHVRQALFSRAIDNDDLLPKIRKPALITHGAKDPIVKPEVVDQHKAGLAHAQVHIMPNAGHAPCWEDSAAFNQRLRRFVEMCSAVTTAKPAVV